VQLKYDLIPVISVPFPVHATIDCMQTSDIIQHKHNTHAQHKNVSFRDEVVSHSISTLG